MKLKPISRKTKVDAAIFGGILLVIVTIWCASWVRGLGGGGAKSPLAIAAEKCGVSKDQIDYMWTVGESMHYETKDGRSVNVNRLVSANDGHFMGEWYSYETCR